MSQITHILQTRTRAVGFLSVTLLLLWAYLSTGHLTPLLLSVVAAFLTYRNWRQGRTFEMTQDRIHSPEAGLYAYTYRNARLLKVMTRRRQHSTILKILLEHEGGTREDLNLSGATDPFGAAREVLELGPLDAVLDDCTHWGSLQKWLESGDAKEFFFVKEEVFSGPPARIRSAEASRALE